MSLLRHLAWLLAALLAGPALPASAQELLRVSPGGPLPTVGAALTRAAAGDTVVVAPGVYRERLVIERPVTLIGEGWPVVDGGGRGHVVEARAAVFIRGFVLRGSGARIDGGDAGILARGAPARIVGNRLEDVLYGVSLEAAPGSVIEGNEIRGKALPIERRGDGIRLWNSGRTRIASNRVWRTRDVVLYFSDGLVVEKNRIADGRYGLHTMYTSDGRFTGNRLEGNRVGAFLMYSHRLQLLGNRIADADGPSGVGLGLKDTDRVRAVGNLLVDNTIGLYMDNSPESPDLANEFAENAFVANGVGVRLLPSVAGNRLHGNAFVGNARSVEVAGGSRRGQHRQNEWRGNHWSDYAGFDEDGDGIGDSPFEHVRLGDELVSRHPALRIFAESPALSLLDLLGRLLPLLEPEPVVVDPAPRLGVATQVSGWSEAPASTSGLNGFLPAAGWTLTAAGGIGIAWRGVRRRTT